jgi:DNA-binding transcriptional ArsR family regulator
MQRKAGRRSRQPEPAGAANGGEEAEPLDAVWRALANGTRRRILDLLRDGPATTGELDAAFPELSRYAVMQHLRVLEEADLLIVRRSGRERYNYMNPVPIQEIHARWVSKYTQPWAEALLGLRAELEDAAEREGA